MVWFVMDLSSALFVVVFDGFIPAFYGVVSDII
jgi:hypothetical protein